MIIIFVHRLFYSIALAEKKLGKATTAVGMGLGDGFLIKLHVSHFVEIRMIECILCRNSEVWLILEHPR